MNLIPTRVHGVLDYLIGVLFIIAPWLFGFAQHGAETWVPVILGIGTICYSILTRYELGLIPVIPMGIHLLLDFCSGVFLLASPWIFGFAHIVYLPHVIVGLIEIGAALMTQHHARPANHNAPDQRIAHA